MGVERQIPLERDSQGQTIHIPSDFAMPGNLAFIRKEGDEVIIRPAKERTMSNLLEWLQQQEPIEDAFPDLNERHMPPREFNL